MGAVHSRSVRAVVAADTHGRELAVGLAEAAVAVQAALVLEDLVVAKF